MPNLKNECQAIEEPGELVSWLRKRFPCCPLEALSAFEGKPSSFPPGRHEAQFRFRWSLNRISESLQYFVEDNLK